jgi:hypothetical protein
MFNICFSPRAWEVPILTFEGENLLFITATLISTRSTTTHPVKGKMVGIEPDPGVVF